MIKTLLIMFSLLFTTAAYADGVDPCPPVAPKPKVHKPHKPRPKVEAKPCDCAPGKDGKDGKDGVPGKDGKPGQDAESSLTQVYNYSYTETKSAPGLSLRIGLMGALYAPTADWAWGPALQLAQPIGERSELVVDAGIALPMDGLDFSPGQEKGLLIHAGFAHYMQSIPRLGFTVGIHSTSIAGSSSNAEIGGSYLGLTGGAVWKTSHVRAELGIVFSGLQDDFKPDTQLGTGLVSSLFFSF